MSFPQLSPKIRGSRALSATGYYRIGQVIAGGSPSTITFAGIPQFYTDLKMVVTGRDTSGAAGDQVMRLQINLDPTAADYTSTNYIAGVNTSVTGGRIASSTNGAAIGSLPGTSGLASAIAITEILIPAYSATTFHKIIHSQISSYFAVGADIETEFFSFIWKSTAAIQTLSLKAPNGFVDGSTATLYGLGG